MNKVFNNLRFNVDFGELQVLQIKKTWTPARLLKWHVGGQND